MSARTKVSAQTKPIGGLMDPRFVYVPSHKTDIRKTIERARAAPLIPAKDKK